MPPLRVLSAGLDLLCEIDDYESLTFTRRYFAAGHFALQVSFSRPSAAHLTSGALVMLAPHKVGIIRHYEVSMSEEGRETLKVSGPTLNGILRQRITVPPAGAAYDRVTGSAETVMRHYVAVNAITPADGGRAMPLLVNGANLGRGSQVTWQSRYKQLDEELEAIALAAGLGWNMSLDFTAMRYVFDVLRGRNLTAGQATLPPVIFAPDYDTIKSQDYMDSLLNFRNAAVIGGQGEAELRTIVRVGASTGLDRHETFVDARDIGVGDEQPPPSPAEIQARLTARGQQALTELARVQTFDAEVLPYGPFVYGVDWDLGDIVTVQNRTWGVTLDARVTEVEEVYESGGMRLRVIFGHNRPTLTGRLRQEFSQTGAEVRR